MGMELSKDFKRCLRQFVGYYSSGSLGKHIGDESILADIDYRKILNNKAEEAQRIVAIYTNNITMSKLGYVHDYPSAMRRAAQYIRSVCDDSDYRAKPPLEAWELELH